jgi:predicted TIM-barrel enzyme
MYRKFNQGVLLIPSILFTLTLLNIYFYISVDKSKNINKHNTSRVVHASLKHQVTRNLPDCIIIGAQKAGTRALITFINLHPEVVSAKAETNFHSKNFIRGFDWYR